MSDKEKWEMDSPYGDVKADRAKKVTKKKSAKTEAEVLMEMMKGNKSMKLDRKTKAALNKLIKEVQNNA